MENINFTLTEIDIINHTTLDSTLDLNLFSLTKEYDIEELKLYYNTNYTLKALLQILQYYGLQKNKMVKEEIIQVLLFFETDAANKLTVDKRLRLWHNIHELKADSYFSKYILF